MVTEKETIAGILKNRGILKEDGTVDLVRFQKLVTEPWIYQKAKTYGFLDGTAANEVVEVPVTPTTVEINEAPVEQKVNLTELPAEEVKVEEPVTEEAPVEEVVEPAEEAVEEKVEEANAVEETASPTEEAPTEAPVEEAAPAKKSTKKSKK
jgi:hypothetical protein